MTVVKFSSETLALRKADEKFIRCFPEKLPTDCSRYPADLPVSNSRLYEKCGPIPLSRPIMKERLRRLGHVLQMKDDRLSFLTYRLGLHGKQVVLVWAGGMS